MMIMNKCVKKNLKGSWDVHTSKGMFLGSFKDHDCGMHRLMQYEENKEHHEQKARMAVKNNCLDKEPVYDST